MLFEFSGEIQFHGTQIQMQIRERHLRAKRLARELMLASVFGALNTYSFNGIEV